MPQPIDQKLVSVLWASPEHAQELARLHAGLFATPWDAASLNGLLSHPASTAFIARVGTPAQTVGFVLAQLAADEAEILTVGVDKAWQRRGIGRRLVEALCRAARKAEARSLYLEVAPDNTAALALYKGFGFTESGRRKSYYARPDGPAEDGLTLVLVL
jgi:ribosomal-protein-alanine N-acetyltransferase